MAVTGYTKKTLIPGEKIVYGATLHWFSFVFPVILVTVGTVLLTWPILVKKYDNMKVEQAQEERAEGGKTKQAEPSRADKFAADADYYIGKALAFLPVSFIKVAKKANSFRMVATGLFFIFVGMVYMINVFLKKISTEMVITTKKIIFKKGFIQVDEVEIPLSNVEGVKVFQTVMDRIFDKGTVLVNGLGMEQLEIKKIADPNKFRHYVYAAVDKYGKGH